MAFVKSVESQDLQGRVDHDDSAPAVGKWSLPASPSLLLLCLACLF